MSGSIISLTSHRSSLLNSQNTDSRAVIHDDFKFVPLLDNIHPKLVSINCPTFIVTGNRVDFEPLQVQSVTYNGDLIQLMSELFHKNIERTLECHGVVSSNVLMH